MFFWRPSVWILFLFFTFSEEAISADIDEPFYHATLQALVDLYQPMASLQGATLAYQSTWHLEKPTANANRNGHAWDIKVNGGLVRDPLLGEDALALIACHELGHHFAGGPIKVPYSDWAAAEGQADAFAAAECLPKVFVNPSENLSRVNRSPVGFLALDQCSGDSTCARILLAGLNMAQFIATKEQKPLPTLDQRDPFLAPETLILHPSPQCRLDTFRAGAVHGAEVWSHRPRCWYRGPNDLRSDSGQ